MLSQYYLSYYCHTSMYESYIRSTDNGGGGSLSCFPQKQHDKNGTPPSGGFWREGGLHETCDSTPWHITPNLHSHSSQPHDTSHTKHRRLHSTNRRLSTPPTAPPIRDNSLAEPPNRTQPPQHPTQHSPRPLHSHMHSLPCTGTPRAGRLEKVVWIFEKQVTATRRHGGPGS